MRLSIRCPAQGVLLLAAWLAPHLAHAQQPTFPRPNNPPAVSPYLNLLRPGADPSVNYYDLVRPQIEFRNAIQSLQQQVTTLGTEAGAGTQAAANLPVTGHPVQFMNTSHYFGGVSAAGGVNRTSGTSRPTVAPRTPSR
jgi:hypothetical protein